MSYFIGVDVGTASVRAGLFNAVGKRIDVATQPISIFEPEEGFYEQSSDNIWDACCLCIKNVCQNVDKSSVAGLGFDATCSLAVLDETFQPITISKSGLSKWNIIMWMDHRAKAQADTINSGKHQVLNYVGGAMSLEMQMPKLLWLKQNLKDQCWDKAGYFFDLPDYLTWRATGSLSRSLCSLVCKWTYLASTGQSHGWQTDFINTIGLQDLTNNCFAKIGDVVQNPGQSCGSGLSDKSAHQLGLKPNIPVATSMIDAHAGGVGCLACNLSRSEAVLPEIVNLPLYNRLVLICGTSACHMTTSTLPIFVPGVWGPYYSSMIPDMWSNEAGQSAAGKLIDYVVESHATYPAVEQKATERNQHTHEVINSILKDLVHNSQTCDSVTELTKDVHMYPDFHGNRSPVGDPTLKGMVCGLTLQTGEDNLALHYLAAIQALAYSSRHIIDSLSKAAYDIKIVHMCGGLSKNKLYVQALADVTGLPIIIPNESESVLLGAAILGATASGEFSSIQDAMFRMGGEGQYIAPNKQFEEYHSKKYKVFLKMLQDQVAYRNIMQTD